MSLGDTGDLTICCRNGVSGATGAAHESGRYLRRPLVEWQNARPEKSDEKVSQSDIQPLTLFARRQKLKAKKQFGKTNGRQIQAFDRLTIQPRQYCLVAGRLHRFGQHVRIEDDHS